MFIINLLNFTFQLKRDADTDTIRGPFNATRQSRYVELLLVVDHEEYKALGDLKIVYQHCKDIANIINAVSIIKFLEKLEYWVRSFFNFLFLTVIYPS